MSWTRLPYTCALCVILGITAKKKRTSSTAGKRVKGTNRAGEDEMEKRREERRRKAQGR